jgi:hypothetical protein
MSPGYDTSDPLWVVETRALCLAIAMIWSVNRRIENQAIPERMLEALPEAEEYLRLIPEGSDNDQQRRARVAGHLAGAAGNSMGDMETALKKLTGRNFTLLHTVEPSEGDAFTYMPGVSPGYPGFEWTSPRRKVWLELNTANLTDSAMESLLRSAAKLLDSMVCADMDFRIIVVNGEDEGFLLGVSPMGITGL